MREVNAMIQEQLLKWLEEEGPKRGLWNDSLISARAGISASVISKARTGLQAIGWEACIKIAEAMGVPAQVVLVIGGHLEPEDKEWSAETSELVSVFANLSEADKNEIMMLIRLKNSR